MPTGARCGDVGYHGGGRLIPILILNTSVIARCAKAGKLKGVFAQAPVLLAPNGIALSPTVAATIPERKGTPRATDVGAAEGGTSRSFASSAACDGTTQRTRSLGCTGG